MGCTYTLGESIPVQEGVNRVMGRDQIIDFIVKNKKLLKKYNTDKDIVFSNTTRDIYLNKILDIHKNNRHYKVSNYSDEFNAELELKIPTDKDIIGVTKFLQGLTDRDGNLLFPEFRDKEYWTRARKRWEDINNPDRFNKEELDMFFPKDSNGDYIIGDNLDYDEMQNMMTHKWKEQARIGTNIHSILEIFFSRNKKSRGNSIRYLPDSEILKIVKERLKDDIKDFSDDTILGVIQCGRNIEKIFDPDHKRNVNFFPEFKVSSATRFTNNDGNQLGILGIIDLLVLDEDGKIHVIDYKTSPKEYIDYDDPKKLTFSYQMSLYNKLLEIAGLTNTKNSLYVYPIKLINLHAGDDDKWSIDGVEGHNTLEELDVLDKQYIQDRIEYFLPELPKIEDSPDKLLETTEDFLFKFFPGYSYIKKVDVVKIQEMVEKNALKNEDTNKWIIDLGDSKIIGNTKSDLVNKIADIKRSTPRRRKETTVLLKDKIKESIKSIGEGDFKPVTIDSGYGDPNHLNLYISKYLNPNWEVLEGNDITDYHGMILLKNYVTKQLDVLMVSNKILTSSIKLPKGDLMSGSYQSDITEQSKDDSYMMDCIEGNIEMLKGMLMLNQMPGLFADGSVVGEISAVNPLLGTALEAAGNHELLYTWNSLLKSGKLNIENNFGTTIKVAKKYDVFEKRFKDIITLFSDNWDAHGKWAMFESSVPKLEEEALKGMSMRDHLLDLKAKMEKQFRGIQNNHNINDIDHPEVRLYNLLSAAIAETSGILPRQIYRNAENYLEDVNVLKKGLGGLELDNPGNLKNKNLNMLTKLVMQVYQNVRESLQRDLPEVSKHVKALKEDKGFSDVTGNQVSLYTNMIYTSETGDLMLRNPWVENDNIKQPLTNAERDFLKYFLIEINKNRNPRKVQDLDNVIKNSNDRFFWLPLAVGDSKNAIALKGLLPALKDKVKQLSPSNIKQRVKDEIEGFMEDENKDKLKDDQLWEMTTKFDKGESSNRLTEITDRTQKYGTSYFEHNLETLLLKHKFAYTTKNYMDEIFPDIQAIFLNIKMMEFAGNADFDNLTKYVENFVNNKILGKRIDDPRFDTFNAYSRKIMNVASYLALAYNPKQLYQALDGMYKNISLIIRKPDGTDAFSFKNFKDSFLSTLPELIHFNNGRTKWQAFNELYALNDMGINEYVNRIKSDSRNGWTFFNRLAFKFTSRPDFYNRASIFGAQMRNDGTWDAHEFTDEGVLIYHFNKDERFSLFANADPKTLSGEQLDKYNKQKGLYISMAKQMEKEHTRNSDGTLFRMMDENGNYNPLPKAYTTQQSESYKDIADSIYGYYAEEKRSMIQAHGLGALIMQMNTYWSAKKNQYLAPGSVKLQGKMTHYKEYDKTLGKDVYYYLDADGNPVREDDPNSTGIPFYRWEGDFQEGIIVTVANLVYGEGNFLERWDKIVNSSDENLRRAYRSNLGQLLYDLTLWIVLGNMFAGSLQQNAKAYIAKNNDAFENLTVDFATSVFKQSFMDFNFASGILNRGINWTPFSLNTLSNLGTSFSRVLSGDMSAQAALLNSSGLTRALKPIFQTEN